MSNPSRFDDSRLLKGTGGVLMNECLQPFCNPLQCDVRLVDDTSPLLDGTRAILILGEAAMHFLCPPTRLNTLNEMRGSPIFALGLPAYASFLPQDAADMKNYERQANPLAGDFHEDDTSEDDDDEGDVKEHGKTKRANFFFWLRQDAQKCIRVLEDRVMKHPTPIYKVNPPVEEVIYVLENTVGEMMDFDIETDYEEQNLLCFAFSFGNSNMVYSCPVLDYRYAIHRSTFNLIRALSIAISNNTLVAHNGAGFDFHVLATKYGIPVKKCYDTMIANHRIYPDIEKSLGHCISLWTNLSFHKDSDSQKYYTYEDMITKLTYCAKDVWGMKLVRIAQSLFAKRQPGLEDSIRVAQDSIRPYLTCSIQGIRFDDHKRQEIMKENDLLMNQYLRILRFLVGEDGLEKARGTGKRGSFASSNAQCVRYFHELLCYAVVARSRETGAPSLGKKAMYKLALKYPDNPVITFVLLYRQVQKEYGALKFHPWKDDNNKLIPYKEEE